MKQVKARGSKKMPIMIPLASLNLEKDSNSPHGLAFKLRDDSELIYAPILNKSGGNFSSTDIDEKTGLPKKVSLGGLGDRKLHPGGYGLSRLNLDRNLSMSSYWSDLQYSYSDGQVVIVSDKSVA